jgi:hypothetical protein
MLWLEPELLVSNPANGRKVGMLERLVSSQDFRKGLQEACAQVQDAGRHGKGSKGKMWSTRSLQS